MSESDKALLAPFTRMWSQAREIEAKGELLMRAAFQVRDPEDAAALKEIAEKCFAEGERIRDSVPVPVSRVPSEAATTPRPALG